jgi:hypothetical protein
MLLRRGDDGVGEMKFILPTVDSNLKGFNFGLDGCGYTRPAQESITQS